MAGWCFTCWELWVQTQSTKGGSGLLRTQQPSKDWKVKQYYDWESEEEMRRFCVKAMQETSCRTCLWSDWMFCFDSADSAGASAWNTRTCHWSSICHTTHKRDYKGPNLVMSVLKSNSPLVLCKKKTFLPEASWHKLWWFVFFFPSNIH